MPRDMALSLVKHAAFLCTHLLAIAWGATVPPARAPEVGSAFCYHDATQRGGMDYRVDYTEQMPPMTRGQLGELIAGVMKSALGSGRAPRAGNVVLCLGEDMREVDADSQVIAPPRRIVDIRPLRATLRGRVEGVAREYYFNACPGVTVDRLARLLKEALGREGHDDSAPITILQSKAVIAPGSPVAEQGGEYLLDFSLAGPAEAWFGKLPRLKKAVLVLSAIVIALGIGILIVAGVMALGTKPRAACDRGPARHFR